MAVGVDPGGRRVRDIPPSLVSHPFSSQGVKDTNRARNNSNILNFNVQAVSSLLHKKKEMKKKK